MKNYYIMNEHSLTVYTDKGPQTVSSEHENWGRIIDALKAEDFESIPDLIDITKVIADYVNGRLEVRGGYVYYDGEPLHNSLTQRIVQMHSEGFNIKPMVNFLKNLMDNPSNRAINELYAFLEVGKLPITPDGCFLAYKRIRKNWTDTHSGTIDNSIGSIVEMDRQKVDDDSNRTCSHGLHACSLGYLQHFWGERLVALKINPKDVVSIPRDYNNSKLRCCRYEVVEELPMSLIQSDAENHWETSVADYEEIEDIDEYY